MIDVREIKLNMCYPESRQEDITDAFTRWYIGAVEIGNKAIKKLEAENAKLREFAEMFAKVADEVGCDHCPYCDPDLCDEETDPMKDGCRLYEELRELGVTND